MGIDLHFIFRPKIRIRVGFEEVEDKNACVHEPLFIPILRVKDARKSAQFYRELLGLTCEWEHQFGPDYPLLMSVSCDFLNLFLSEHKGTGTDRSDLYVYVPEVDSFYAKCGLMGVTIEQSPKDQPWGVRDIQIRDMDQHRLTLAARTR